MGISSIQPHTQPRFGKLTDAQKNDVPSCLKKERVGMSPHIFNAMSDMLTSWDMYSAAGDEESVRHFEDHYMDRLFENSMRKATFPDFIIAEFYGFLQAAQETEHYQPSPAFWTAFTGFSRAFIAGRKSEVVRIIQNYSMEAPCNGDADPQRALAALEAEADSRRKASAKHS